MKLVDALKILSNVDAQARVYPVYLASGFTPLHLATLISAELQQRLPGRRVDLRAGLFGDIQGNIRRATETSNEAVCVQVEWADLDARLGMRQSGSWDVGALSDVLSTCRMTLRAIEEAIGPAAARMSVVVSAPTLPFPPISHEAGTQAGSLELQLRAEMAAWLARLGAMPGVRIVRSQAVDVASPCGDRFDVQSELHFGFPYSMQHAGALAAVFAALVAPAAPKKGLITDLDDTLWKGTLGEVGVDGVNWDIDHGSQIHGAYQRLLNSLASAGVLIGVATRNDAANVQRAFERPDLVLDPKRVFPVEAGWGPKSPLVRRILDAWNIRAEDVVFVDNMAAELGEVQLSFPGMTGILFPEKDQDVAALMDRLRDLFGKERVAREDGLRIGSLRGAETFRSEAAKSGDSAELFLSQAQGEIVFSYGSRSDDPRILELVNKTNQFNLNARRFTGPEWRSRGTADGAFVLAVDYKDKYGALGKIAVLSGFKKGAVLHADVWVMSCRAFSRRIEFRTLAFLFEKTGASDIEFDYQPTDKNAIMQEFVDRCSQQQGGRRVCAREAFLKALPKMYFTAKETPHGA